MATEIQTQTVQSPDTARQVRAWYAPLVDILERADRFEVVADLPGVALEDVDVTLHEDTLTIEAHRGDVGYRRAFTVPADVVGGEIGARLDKGVLTVTLPRAKPAGPKKIEVRG